jgi:ABC-type phosphonate transport system ATPase subunit
LVAAAIGLSNRLALRLRSLIKLPRQRFTDRPTQGVDLVRKQRHLDRLEIDPQSLALAQRVAPGRSNAAGAAL